MTQRCAHILNGVVTNVIIADPATFSPGDGGQIMQSNTAQIGWTYANGSFTAVTPPVSYQTRGLTFLQFMALFTPAEQAAIVGSADVRVKLFVMMATGSGSLDLTHPEVVMGMAYLTSRGLILATRVPQILSGAPH